MKNRNNKATLARQRLEKDIRDAVVIAAARRANAYGDVNTRAHLLRTIMESESDITHNVIQLLRRNWKITERARGARTVE